MSFHGGSGEERVKMGKSGRGGEVHFHQKKKKRGWRVREEKRVDKVTGTLVCQEEDKMGATPHWSPNYIFKS